MLRVEYAKMRRLRSCWVAVALGLAGMVLTSMRLADQGYLERINHADTYHWEGQALSLVMIQAMTGPLLAAVLASRQVEIEHLSNGWTSAGLSGQRPGQLCLTKWLALTPIVAMVTGGQFIGTLVLSRLAGAQAELSIPVWIGLLASSTLVTLTLLGAHLWLSAIVENQLVALGVGVLGAFTGVFSLLMPQWLAYSLPWGYYAVVSPYAVTDAQTLKQVTPSWVALAIFLLVSSFALLAAKRRLDRKEI